ncbi:MAG: SGNH/GDSL hydrolase family protein, partial [Bacteroidota bacterium]
LCVGDSITIGARSYLGYPEYLGALLAKHTNSEWNVINNAISGYTTCEIMRVVSERHSNIQQQNPSLATILIGTNDVKKKTRYDLFEIAYQQLLIKVKLLLPCNNIVLIKIPRFTKGVKYPYTYQMNEEVTKYNKIITGLSKKYQTKLLELTVLDAHVFDGVHLNETGSEDVAKQILPVILKDKGYEGTADQS